MANYFYKSKYKIVNSKENSHLTLEISQNKRKKSVKFYHLFFTNFFLVNEHIFIFFIKKNPNGSNGMINKKKKYKQVGYRDNNKGEE